MSMHTLLSALGTAKIDYVLVGGLAVLLHGYQRNTTDVDVVLALNDENLSNFGSSGESVGRFL